MNFHQYAIFILKFTVYMLFKYWVEKNDEFIIHNINLLPTNS